MTKNAERIVFGGETATGSGRRLGELTSSLEVPAEKTASD